MNDTYKPTDDTGKDQTPSAQSENPNQKSDVGTGSKGGRSEENKQNEGRMNHEDAGDMPTTP